MKSAVIQLILVVILIGASFFLRQTYQDISLDAKNSISNIQVDVDTEEVIQDLEPLDQVDLILPTDGAGSSGDIGIIGSDNLIDTDEELALQVLEGDEDTEVETDDNINLNTQSISDQYVDYNPLAVRSALQTNKSVILFFYAAWDATSTALDESIVSSPDLIPADTIVYQIDYDDSSLREIYSVVSQPTMILLGTDGEESQRSTNIFAVDQLADFVGGE